MRQNAKAAMRLIDPPAPADSPPGTAPADNAQGVFRQDAGGVFVQVDARAAGLLGYTEAELTGLHYSVLHFEDGLTRAQHNFAQRLAGSAGTIEYRLRRKDGTPAWIAVSSVPHIDAAGNCIGVTGFLSDIDQRRRLEHLAGEERRLLRLIAGHCPLSAVMEDLCMTLADVSRHPLQVAVMLADGPNLACLAAPGLPPRYRAEHAALPLATSGRACAEAVRGGRVVVVADTAGSDAAPETAALRRDYGVGAVWAYPVVQDGETLGALVLLPRAAGEPDAEDERAIRFALEVARLALAHERKAEALRLSEQRFRDYAELSADWYWEQDAEFRFTYMSGGVYNKGGFRVTDSLGKTRWELPIEGIEAKQWADHRAQLDRREVFRDFTYVIRAADGTQRWFSVSGKPMFGANDRFAGYRGIGRDITEQVQAEQKIANLAASLETRVRLRTAALEEANRELDAFNFSVSHDLRTPLRAIEGFSQALLEDHHERLDPAGQDHLRRIVAATTRMGELIEALYDLSRLSRAPLFLRPVNLTALARELAAELGEREPGRRLAFVVEETPAAEGDARLLRIVLANLLGNAWKYTAKTGCGRIVFGARLDDHSRCVYFVRDNGAGFDMRFADKLFRMFHRLHREEEFGGQGVGLTTARRIITRHGGRIWAEAEKGAGATFFFTLWEEAALRNEILQPADKGWVLPEA
jgi:PAS domain S-box-containing protein